MIRFYFSISLLIVSMVFSACNRLVEPPKGSLFIIGGGDRSPALMTEMITTANVKEEDWIAVLPMAGEDPDSSFIYFVQDAALVTHAHFINLDFSNAKRDQKSMLDSLKMAKLIFICGGDQNRFMQVAKEKGVVPVIQDAYMLGACIAGTSAGAAVMGEWMITGEQKSTKEYEATYDVLERENGIYAAGLNLLPNSIVDQHFVVRSRYNRLLSALVDYPGRTIFGIDEETALVVKDNAFKVVGSSQVVTASPVTPIRFEGKKFALRDVSLQVYIPGDEFE
jgi:cyanophycinase